MGPAKPQKKQCILPNHVQSSNSTATLFLGRGRRPWMQGIMGTKDANDSHNTGFNVKNNSRATKNHFGTGTAANNCDRRPSFTRSDRNRPIQPRPPRILSSSSSSSSSNSISAPQSVLARFDPGTRPTSSNDVPITAIPTAEAALMTPVTPGESSLQSLQNFQHGSSSTATTAAAAATTGFSTDPPSASSLSHPIVGVLPTALTTAASTSAAATATAAAAAPVPAAYQSTSLPSPDPSHESRTSPASTVGWNNTENPPSSKPSSFFPRMPHVTVPLHVQFWQQPPDPSSEGTPTTSTTGAPSRVLADLSRDDGERSTPAAGANSTGPRRVAHPRSGYWATPPGGTTTMAFGNEFWAAALESINRFLIARGENRASSMYVIEVPRLRLLRDACRTRDMLYLLLHQLYCVRSSSPSDFVGLSGFSESHMTGLDIVQQLLVDNGRVSSEFLNWCVCFPCQQLSIAMETEFCQATLQNVKQSLTLIAKRWDPFEKSIAERRYPPLIDELVANFGVASPVLTSIMFTAVCRRMFSGQYDKELQCLFLRNRENYGRRFADPANPVPAHQMQRENQELIREYLALYRKFTARVQEQKQEQVRGRFAMREQQVTLPSQPLPMSTVTETRQPARIPSQGPHSSMNPPTSSLPISTSGHAALRGSFVGPSNPSSNPNPTNPYTHAAMAHQVPSSSIPGGQVPPISHGPASSSSPVLWPQQQPPVPRTSGYANVDPHRQALHMTSLPHMRHLRYPAEGVPQQIQSRENLMSPLSTASSRMHGPPPPPPPPPSSRPNLSPTMRVYPHAQGHDAGMPARISPHVPPQTHVLPSTHTPQPPSPHPPASPQVSSSVGVPFLPPRNAIPAQMPRPHPLQVALHQAHLRNPVRRCVRRGSAGLQETELFQYLSSFAVPPAPLGKEECAFHWTFSLSRKDCAKFPHTIDNGMGRRLNKVFFDGSQTYRLRCIKVTPTSDINEPSWAVTEAVWPSVLYVFVNGAELHVRRKMHNGKDLPLDITDHLHEGENSVSLHFLRNTAESRDLLYAAGVETLKISSLQSAMALAQVLPAAESRQQIQKRLSSNSNEKDNDDVAVVSEDITVNIMDPFMARAFDVPARSRHCMHIECFDLKTFIATKASKSGKNLMKDFWKCPICGGDARPHTLIIDGFLTQVRDELSHTNKLEGAKAIVIRADGSWKLKMDEEDDARRPGLASSESMSETEFDEQPPVSAEAATTRRKRKAAVSAITTSTTNSTMGYYPAKRNKKRPKRDSHAPRSADVVHTSRQHSQTRPPAVIELD